MKHLSSRRWRVVVLILIPLLVSFACLPGGSPTETPTLQTVTVQGELVLGPGAFDLVDTREGLSNLTSYKATLSLAFDGTRDGQPSQWSRTYIMLTTKEPAMRELTLERAGDLADLAPVFMAEADGAAYERRGENACYANMIEKGYSIADRLEPAGLLFGVIGADIAGSEKVNDTAANHYTFDERAFGHSGLAQSTGEMWVASEGGYIIKYLVASTGNADYFGDGIEGTLTWDYELTDVNQPLTIELPADCPAGMVDAPLLPDASHILNMPSVLSFDTSTSLTEAAAYYQEQIPKLGWEPISEAVFSETAGMLNYQQGGQNMTVTITADAGVTTVNILLERNQE